MNSYGYQPNGAVDGYHNYASEGTPESMMSVILYLFIGMLVIGCLLVCCCIGFGVGFAGFNMLKPKRNNKRLQKSSRYQRLQQISVHQTDDEEDEEDDNNNGDNENLDDQ